MKEKENKKLKTLLNKLETEGHKISKAEKMKMLIYLQDGLIKKKQTMVDFQEPVMFFARNGGELEFYDKVTQGKFLFKHSNGEERYIEIRPQDQLKFEYGDRRVRCYFGHEDRPFTGFYDMILDTDSITNAIRKISATEQKYEEALLREKNKGMSAKGKMWMYIAFGVVIVAFGVGTWLIPALTQAKVEQANIVKNVGENLIILGSFKYSNALRKVRQWLKKD